MEKIPREAMDSMLCKLSMIVHTAKVGWTTKKIKVSQIDFFHDRGMFTLLIVD